MLQYLPILLLMVVLGGCDLLAPGGTGGPADPGRRDYTWTVDTLASPPGGWVHEIWGSSPKDVWVVMGTGMETLWHYDGNEWTPWPERIAPSIYSLYGFGSDEIWIGGA